MQCRYTITLTMDELRNLPAAAKQALADLDLEFANMVGAKQSGAPAAPAVIPAAKNQPNQASTIDPTIMASGVPGLGIPGQSVPPNVAPQVPSAVPQVTGIPGIPGMQVGGQPSGMMTPAMQPPHQAPPAQPAPQQQAPPAQPAPQQQAPPAQPTYALPQQQMTAPPVAPAGAISPVAGVDAKFARDCVSHALVAHGSEATMNALSAAVSRGMLPDVNISKVTDATAGHVVAILNQSLSTTYGIPQ